jgi:hypothetical protein
MNTIQFQPIRTIPLQSSHGAYLGVWTGPHHTASIPTPGWRKERVERLEGMVHRMARKGFFAFTRKALMAAGMILAVLAFGCAGADWHVERASAEEFSTVKDAVGEWCGEVGFCPTITHCPDRECAGPRVLFLDDFSGLTDRVVSVGFTRIQVGEPLAIYVLRKSVCPTRHILLHEFGHVASGRTDHSPDPNAIMYHECNDTDHLTGTDIHFVNSSLQRVAVVDSPHD